MKHIVNIISVILFSTICYRCKMDADELIVQMPCTENDAANTHLLQDDINELLQRHFERNIPGVSVAIRSETMGTYDGTAGSADISTNLPLGGCHTFRAASITKNLMAVAIMLLHEDERIELDMNISEILGSEILSNLPKAYETTVAELLSHRSGIPNYDDNTRFVAAVLNEPGQPISIHDRLTFAKELDGTPDWVIEKFGLIYSNTNYLLLQLILEEVTGIPYHDFLTEHILSPLGMEHSSFSTIQPYPQNLSSGYCDMYDNGTLRDVSLFDSERWSGEAALISNTFDVMTYFEALLSGEIVSMETVQLMIDQGFGFLEEEINGLKAIGHDGQAVGYSGEMWNFPDIGLKIVLMGNKGRISSDQPSIQSFENLLIDLVKLHNL